MGGYSWEDLLAWYDPAGILQQLTALVAVQRPGYEEAAGYRDTLEARLSGIKERLIKGQAPQLDISATDLRRRVAENRPIKEQRPEGVESYIIEYGLYAHFDQKRKS